MWPAFKWKKTVLLLPMSESGNWITPIQNTMPIVVSVAVSFLVATITVA